MKFSNTQIKPGLAVAVFLMLGLLTTTSSTANAPSYATIERLTNDTNEDSGVKANGSIVTWQSRINGQLEIFVLDINDPDHTRIQVTNNDYNDFSPVTDGHTVAWIGAISDGGELFEYNIDTKAIKRVTKDTKEDAVLMMADGQVAWTSSVSQGQRPTPAPSDVYLYEIASGKITNISKSVDPYGSLSDGLLYIDNSKVVWEQYTAQGSKLFSYNLTTHTTSPAPEDFSFSRPANSNDYLSALSSYMDGAYEVFLKCNVHGHIARITNNATDDLGAILTRDNLFWIGGSELRSEVYMMNVSAITCSFGSAACKLRSLSVSARDSTGPVIVIQQRSLQDTSSAGGEQNQSDASGGAGGWCFISFLSGSFLN